jgi:hypothetical protein
MSLGNGRDSEMKNQYDRIADGLIGGVLFAVIFLCYIFSCLGCATTRCPPCVPETEVITVYVPTLSCPAFEPLPALTYPEWPELPQNASSEELRAFYANVVAAIHAREKILLERISALELLLDSYR